MAAIKSTLVAVVFIATTIPATKLDNSEDIGVSAPRCNGAEVEFEHSQLLMCYRNEWRGVCDGKKTFNKTDAEVVCYQLGLSGDVINTNFHCDSSDRNVSEIAEFKDVSCTGREEELHDCKMNTRLKNDDCPAEDCICFHCPEEYQVRLFNMTNGADYQGRVQHYYDGGWNELCVEEDSDWTDSNSHVVCQQLGMGIPLWAAATVEPSHPIPRFISSDINCTGSEETVKDCKTQSWTMPSQCSGYVPWVSCEGPPVTITNAISEDSYNSITVEWSINKIKTQHYPVVTGYEMMIANANEMYMETYPGWKRGKATVHDLLPFTEYTITVRALMGEHRGPLSEPMQVKIKTGPPVTITNAISGGPFNSITVEWSINKTKAQHHPVVTGYEVIITNTKANEKHIETYSGWERGKATVHGLLPFTEYTITVRALMGEHRGLLSEPMQVKTGPNEVVLGLALSTAVFGLLLVFFITRIVVSVLVYVSCNRRRRDRRNEVPNERDPLLRDGHQPVNGPQPRDGDQHGARGQPPDGQHSINEVESSDEEEDEFISFPRDNQ